MNLSPQNSFSPDNKKSTMALVSRIKSEDQDFEWYPTTEEMLKVIKDDIDKMVDDYDINPNPSILDCGAGDGRSLKYLTEGQRYAIEKSKPLIQAMDKSIFVIGAEFHQQTLMDKNTTLTIANPPYSEFEDWSTKIIRESNSAYIYLVIPSRWKSSKNIQEALEIRGAKAETLKQKDFLSADRVSRAKVDIIKVSLVTKSRHRSSSSRADTDPFTIWFNDNFKIEKTSGRDLNDVSASLSEERIQNELVTGKDLIQVLIQLYERDLNKLMENYRAFETLDADLLDELGVSFKDVREGLRLKVKGLKNIYWQELFNNLKKITDKLTKSSRERLLSNLTLRTDVDFNSENIYAVVIWVIKNANHYFDEQLVSLVKSMVEKANIVLYKSNTKTYGEEKWRYCRTPEGLSRYSLETRLVLERAGGLVVSEWSFDLNRYNGLTGRAHDLIMDILTVATNLGFDTTNYERPMDYQWESNKGKEFHFWDHVTGKKSLLMTVKAFKNGNCHVKFNQAFMRKLNVEFGRLEGWLKSAQEAAEELDITIDEAAESFNQNLKLTNTSFLQLGFKEAA